jgi:hypothetical protein
MEATMKIQQEAIPLVKSSLEMKRKALEFNLQEYQRRIGGFEVEHTMTSEQFAKKFGAGELGDNTSWFEWEFLLDALRETEHQLALLATVRL